MLNALPNWLATQPTKSPVQTSLVNVLRDENFLDGTVKLLRDPEEISRRLAELYEFPDELQLWSRAGVSVVSGCLVAPEQGKRGLKLRVTMPCAPSAGQSINLAYARRSGLFLVDTRLLSAEASVDGHCFNLDLEWPETILVHEMRQSRRFRAQGMSSASWQSLLELLGCKDRSIIDDVAEGGVGLRLTKQQVDRLGHLASFTWKTLGIPAAGDETTELAVTSLRPGQAGFYLVGCKFVAPTATWQREWRKRLMKAQATLLVND